MNIYIIYIDYGYGYGDGMVKDVLRDSPWIVTRTMQKNGVFIIGRDSFKKSYC